MQNNEINIKKKEILLKLLNSLTDSWDIAKGIYVLVQDIDPNDDLIDNLIEIMKTSMKNVEDKKAREKMEESINVLKKMQELEKEERMEELESLESSLDELNKI